MKEEPPVMYAGECQMQLLLCLLDVTNGAVATLY